MDLTGEYVITAPRQTVWEALNDPEILRQCISGCEEITRESDTRLTARVTAKVGPVKAKFVGEVTLSNLNPPESYTISGEGKGGAAGFAKGGADVSLAEVPEGTRLTYEVHATVGGKLAQLGSRLVAGTAKKQAEDFFNRLGEIVGEGAAQPEPAPAVPVATAAATTTAPMDQPPAAPSSATATDIPVPSPAAAAPAAEPPHAAAAPPGTPLPEQPSIPADRGLSPVIWVGGLIVLAVVMTLISIF